MLASSEDGDWYAFSGEMTREQVVAALRWLGIGLTPSDSPFALELKRGHIVLLDDDELEAEHQVELVAGESHEEYWTECAADRAGAREAWIAVEA